MIAAATWLPTAYGYSLEATGAVGEVTWYRSSHWPDGRSSSRKLGTGASTIDLTVPLDGATVSYTAVDSAGTASVTVTPAVPTKPVLGLVAGGELPAVEVVVESLHEQEVTARGVFHDVLDRNEPYYEPMRPIDKHGEMSLLLAHPPGGFPGASLSRLRALLRTGQPLMLRTLCNDKVEDLAFAALRWTEGHTGTRHGPDRRTAVSWRAVSPVWGDEIAVAGRVWAMVPPEFPTWADAAANGTWLDMVEGR